MNTHDPANAATPNTFQPDTPLIYATAVPLLVQELGLNMNGLRFIKAPQASDYFTRIDNAAPYSQQMLVASLNGLPLSTELDPAAIMPRTDFAVLLWHVVERSNSQQTQAFHMTDDHEAVESVSVADEGKQNEGNAATRSESSVTSEHQERSPALQQLKCSANLEPSEHPEPYVCQQIIDCGLISIDDAHDVRPHEPITYAEATSMLEHAKSLMNSGA